MCRGGFRAVRERPAVGFLVRGCRGRVRFSGRFRGASFEIPFGDRQGTRFAGRYGEFRVRSRCRIVYDVCDDRRQRRLGFRRVRRGGLFGPASGEVQPGRESDHPVHRPADARLRLVFRVGRLSDAGGGFYGSGLGDDRRRSRFAGLLVCNVPMFALKFTHYRFAGNRVRYVFALCSLAALCAAGIAAIPFIILAYIVVSVSVYAFRTQW